MSDETIATGYLRLVPTAEGIQGALGGQFSSAGTAAAGLFSSSFIGGAKGLLATLGGFYLAKQVQEFVASGIDGLSRIETINSQTQATITATGGAAGVSAKHVQELALALEANTASEAESVQEGANLLLTFRNIRNEAGAGNDIFDQATTTLVDYSRAMGVDASSAAITLGKALNDPVKGITALGRAGVQFTQDQKDLIQSLVDSGDLLGAQKIILEELNSEFGGSGASYAETFAGKLYLVDDAFGDVSQTVVSGTMPALKDFLDLILDVMTRINESDTFKGIIEKIDSIGVSGVEKLGGVVELIDRLAAEDNLSPDSIIAGLSNLFPTLEPLLGLLTSLSPLFPEIHDGLVTIVTALSQEGVTDSLVELITDVLPPLVDLLVAIAPLIPPIASLLTTLLPPAIGIVRENLGPLLEMLDVLEALWQSTSMQDWAGRLLESGTGVSNYAVAIAGFVKGVVNPVIDALNGLGDAVEGFVNRISSVFGGGTISIPNIQRLTSAIDYSAPSRAASGSPRTGKSGIPYMADGGTIARAGYAIVGEAGPELLNLNVGAQVRPLDNLGPDFGGPLSSGPVRIAREDLDYWMRALATLLRNQGRQGGVTNG